MLIWSQEIKPSLASSYHRRPERQRIGSQIDAAFIPCVYEVRPRGDVTFNHKILLVMSTTD